MARILTPRGSVDRTTFGSPFGGLRGKLLAIWACIAGGLFVLNAGGDWMPHGRFLSLFVLAAFGLGNAIRLVPWLARNTAHRELAREFGAFVLLTALLVAWWDYQAPRLRTLRQKSWCHFCERVADTERDVAFPSFAHTVLVDMRARLRESSRPNRIFETALELAKAAGLVGRKRVVDSTALYDAVATQDTVTMIRGAIRALLGQVEGTLQNELRAVLRRDDGACFPLPGSKPRSFWRRSWARISRRARARFASRGA